MKPQFERYNESYATGNDKSGIALGPGTRVEMTDLDASREGHTLTIRATYTVTKTVNLSGRDLDCTCSFCGEKANTPENDQDALMYLLENHQQYRIAWGRPENHSDIRREAGDCYPVAGWHKLGEDTACPTCYAALKALKNKKGALKTLAK